MTKHSPVRPTVLVATRREGVPRRRSRLPNRRSSRLVSQMRQSIRYQPRRLTLDLLVPPPPLRLSYATLFVGMNSPT
jgi:hypothetical protein